MWRKKTPSLYNNDTARENSLMQSWLYALCRYYMYLGDASITVKSIIAAL